MWNKIQDEHIVQQINGEFESLFFGDYRLRFEPMTERGWGVVPVPNSSHDWFLSTRFYAQNFYDNTHKKFDNLIIVDLKTKDIFQAVNSVDTYIKFSEERKDNWYALTTLSFDFLILREPEHYLLYAGNVNFLINSVGSSILTTRRAFKEYFVDDDQWDNDIRKSLEDVFNHYNHFNGEYAPVFNNRTVDLLKSQIFQKVLESPSEISTHWLLDRNWVAVVLPDVVNLVEAEWIAKSIDNINSETCYAISTDEGRVLLPDDVYELISTKVALETIHVYFPLQSVIIVDDGLQFSLLKARSYYYIIAGQEEFVRQAVGGSIELARQRFKNYYSEGWWTSKELNWLHGVAAKYET